MSDPVHLRSSHRHTVPAPGCSLGVVVPGASVRCQGGPVLSTAGVCWVRGGAAPIANDPPGSQSPVEMDVTVLAFH